jgi:hypothetical protein
MRKSRILLLESRNVKSGINIKYKMKIIGINIFDQSKHNDEGTDISCHCNFTLVQPAMVSTHVRESLRK